MVWWEIWKTSSAVLTANMVYRVQCLFSVSRVVSLFVHIKRTVLHCVCAVTSSLVTVVCSVLRDAHASTILHGLLTSFNAHEEATLTYLH